MSNSFAVPMSKNSFSFFRDLRGGAGEIRCRQIAEYLGGKINPESGYENDVCIYVLSCHPRERPEPRHSYYDIMDVGLARMGRIRQLTRGSIIAISKSQFPILKEYYKGRGIYFVPQHHCNFRREKRPDRPVKVVGCVGGDASIQYPQDELKKMLSDIGLEWKFGNFNKRIDVVNFYKTMDIQIVYKKEHPRGIIEHMNPLKLSNAGSFGIPTVAFPEPSYIAEWRDDCLWGDSMQEIMGQVKRLASDSGFYAERSCKALAKAEEYHISNIAKYYLNLPGN